MKAEALGKRETVGKVERGLRVLVAVGKHLRLVLRTQPRSLLTNERRHVSNSIFSNSPSRSGYR